MLKRFLDSVETQTRKPDYVIVSCSSSQVEDLPKDYNYSFPFQILLIESRLNAAQNRNLAADKLIELGCDYISFFDCDDVMHPQRIEAILEGFQTKSVDFITHNYIGHSGMLDHEFELYDKFITKKNCITFKKTSKYLREFNKNIHAAQISVSKDIFKHVRFREEKDYERGEDTHFLCDILDYCKENNLSNSYIANPLSKYFHEGVWHS